MVFSDTSTKQGLIQDCEMLVFGAYGRISDNASLLYNFTNLINRQYDKAVSIIIEADGRWQYDDNTYSTTMVNTATITSGQYRYTLDPEHLKLLGVRVKPNGATSFIDLESTDRRDQNYPDFGGTQTGLPQVYDKEGDILKLHPTPNYTQSESIEIVVQRVPNYFVYTDTTKEAGIQQTHHRFLSLGASLEYAVMNALATKNDIAALFQDERDRMEASYSRRNRDERDRMLVANHNNK